MSGSIEDLPPEIQSKVMTFLRETEDGHEVEDMEGLVKFIVENRESYPALLSLLKIDYDAVVDHFKRTGKVLPGMRIVHTETAEGSNVTKLEVFRGPIPPKEK